MTPQPFFIAQGNVPVYLRPDMANRHGLIAGATGTGKTVTLRVLAENFSAMGVPVFMADVKGDLGGMAKPIVPNDFLKKRAEQMQVQLLPNGFPVTFWDLFGKSGHPIRATISEMGPLLLSQLLDLNDTQEGVLNIVFHVADEEGLLLIDLKDLQAMLGYIADNAAEYTTKYGNVSAVTVGAIQRALLTLQIQGGDQFFGEPALQLEHLMQTAEDGRGVINILAADKLITSPRSYAAMMLWLLSELFEQLPEVGDIEKPKLVFFFDEAHLLFTSMPNALQEKIEQVVRLVRSKGVGVYFVSQNPIDIPDKVLGQLGNRIQHALRAFTPRDQKAVKTAAETFRQNPKFDTATVIMEMGVGEALVSVLDEKGIPTVVERALIAPPSSQLQPLAEDERAAVIEGSPIYGVYDQTIDRESASEILSGKPSAPIPAPVAPPLSSAGGYDAVASARARAAARQAAGGAPVGIPIPAPSRVVPSAADEDKQALLRARVERMQAEAEERRSRVAQKDSLLGGLVKAAATSATRSLATSATRTLMRGLLGGLFGSSRKR